jgi:hypothetical protein
VARSRRWRLGAAEAQHMAGEAAASDAKQSRAGARGRRREGVRRTFLEFAKPQGSHCKLNFFPLFQSSNEKMVKMKVVEFFKSYNFALGLKFKNLKHKDLFYHFALNSNLIKFLSLTM